jgi:murein DD-endopeptidase MepM/ murein hydrolase activator NlpD
VDSVGRPIRVLTAVTRGNGERWIGTYGMGIYVCPAGAPRDRQCAGRRIAHSSARTSISLDFVHAIAFGAHGEIWYGTVGNGWGLSTDDGQTWRNWTFSELGPEWQYVAPDGIVIRGDTVVIATADGLQVTTDDGAHWTAIGDATGPAAKGPADTAIEVLPNEYVTRLGAEAKGWRVEHLRGTSRLDLAACLRLKWDGCVIESKAARRRPDPVGLIPAKHPLPGSARDWSPWFARPIAPEDNDHIDQTYRWGSTMGGTFQPHQGVEFNNPDGTPVHAIGNGTVVYAGRAEQGALVVAIRHDTMLTVGDRKYFVYSVYYHNSTLLTHVGAQVRRGEVISRVGHTGRATNDHMHLEVHAAPVDSVRAIVDSLNRYPPFTTNTELWITPLPGTGIVAGTVIGADGKPVPQARVFGIVKPAPRETPYAFAETYGPRNHPHPVMASTSRYPTFPPGRTTCS